MDMEGDSLLQEVPTGVRRKYLLQGFLAGVLCMLVLVVGFLVLSGGHVEYGEHAKATVGTDSEYLESTTGVIFPISMKPPADSEHEYKILGAGPRIKKIGPIGVKVYGVAMYAETKSAKDALKSYAGKVCCRDCMEHSSERSPCGGSGLFQVSVSKRIWAQVICCSLDML